MSTNEHQPLTSRQRWTLVAAAVCAAGAVLLAALPIDWIEEVFGVEPDGGNGLLEFAPIVVLAVVCSALAFLLMVALVSEIGPVKATAITYVNPAVAIIAGVAVLGERVTVWTIVGFALVLAGSFLVTRRRREPVAAEGPEEACAEQAAATDEQGAESAAVDSK